MFDGTGGGLWTKHWQHVFGVYVSKNACTPHRHVACPIAGREHANAELFLDCVGCVGRCPYGFELRMSLLRMCVGRVQVPLARCVLVAIARGRYQASGNLRSHQSRLSSVYHPQTSVAWDGTSLWAVCSVASATRRARQAAVSATWGTTLC